MGGKSLELVWIQASNWLCICRQRGLVHMKESFVPVSDLSQERLFQGVDQSLLV